MAVEVGIRELKRDLSSLVERAESGEIITVTRRGHPVARVIPAEIPSGMAKLMEDGKVRWSGRKPQLPRKLIKLRGEGPTAAEIVIEGRR